MTLFYLVRHGQIERGQAEHPADPPLSLHGRTEAEQVVTYLRPHPILRIYASPLRRAQETAAIIATLLGLPVITEPLLRERINFGDLPEQSFEQFVTVWEQSSRERDFVPPYGDSSRKAGARLEAFMSAVYAELPTAEVVAVAHGGLIADFLLNVCSAAELAQIAPAFAATPYAGEVMRNGAITVVEYRSAEKSREKESEGNGGYRVKAIALTEHLPTWP
jgi:broad specificity phosphatase PhoE